MASGERWPGARCVPVAGVTGQHGVAPTRAAGCGQNTPCTFDEILSALPGASVEEAPNCGPGGVKAPCPGSLGLNQGSFNSGSTSNADALYVSVDGEQTTFDFGVPVGPPASKDECKKGGGWQAVDAPRRFKPGALRLTATAGLLHDGRLRGRVVRDGLASGANASSERLG